MLNVQETQQTITILILNSSLMLHDEHVIYHLNKGLSISPKFILVVQEHSHVSLIACKKGAMCLRTAFIPIILFLLRTAHKQKC